MTDFVYRAVSVEGRVETGEVFAASEDEAMRQLEDRRLTVFELNERVGASGGGVRLRRKAVGHADLVVLIRELATLANSGISLASALETLKDANRETPLAAPMEKMLSAIHGGDEFSSALGKADLALPEYAVAMVRAGEATGNLGMALGRCAEQMEFDQRMRAQTREALIYPTILVSTGSLAVIFIFSFVVPRFASILKGRIDSLPWISEFVLKTGMFFNANLWAILGAGVVVALLGVTAVRNDAVRKHSLELAVRLPVLGDWIRSGETARWTSALAMLLQSRVPILSALELTAASVRLSETIERLNEVRAAVSRGKRMSQAVEEQRLLEPTSLSMIRVGEQSGELGNMLQHVAHYWSEKNQSVQRKVVALVEPMSILLLGVIIGFVMVGVVMAMASLTEVKL